ncbi:MAG: TolB family protein [Chloroflexota bacterium]
MKYIPLTIILLFLLPWRNVSGQYYNTGQDPSSVRWLHIRTPKFDVIYPESYDLKGIDFARILDKSYSELASFFPVKRSRIPVVIHSYSTRANGYVAWAPKRMEIYPAPDQNAIPGSQHRLLAIHETTHVFEMESLNTGFSKAMSFLVGEQFTGVTAALLPLWYLEGHAVLSETLLSSSGRGRNPAFQQEMKAIALEHGNFSYDRILNGSFRTHIPDHYQSGYQMTAWAIAKYDPAVWNKVLQFTGNEPFTLNPVNISLRKNTGLTKRKLYTATFDSLKTKWSYETSGRKTLEAINPPKNGEYINYYSPVCAGKDSIIAIKTSMSSTTRFVLISGGHEKILHRPGSMYPWIISTGNGKIAWVENRPDIRWVNRDFTVIRVYDLKTGLTRTVTGKSRYLSASISPDGRRIAAIENTPENRTNLVLIDSYSGTVLKSIPSPENIDIQRPKWSEDGEKITVIYLTDDGEGIMAFSNSGNTWETLLPAGTADIQSSLLRNDSLYYVSSVSGTDNIWVSTGNQKAVRITDTPFGISDPSFAGNNILFSEYSTGGNSISSVNSGEQQKGKIIDHGSSFIIDRLEKPVNKQESVSAGDYNPEPYRKWSHLLRFHSWMPFYADIDRIQSDPASVRPGLTLMSQNTLSTLVTTLGYEYAQNKTHQLHSRISWYGIYPVITARIDQGYHSIVATNPRSMNIPSGLRFNGEIAFPFYFSSGYFLQYLRASVNADYSNNIYPDPDGNPDYGQTKITGRIYFSNYVRRSQRDIYPEWGQTFDLNNVSSPFDSEIFGTSTFLKTSFYFPGILKDDGLKIRFESEKQSQTNFIFSNKVSFPRGYNKVHYPDGFQNIVSDNLNFVSADYVFPVAYPDFILGPVLYVKRIRSGFFFDNAWGKGNRYYSVNSQGRLVQSAYHDYTETFRSYGIELLADFHVLRIPFMISGGVQAAWRPGDDVPVINAVFNMDLYGFSLGR